MRRACHLAIAATIVAAPACGGESRLDTEETERELAAEVEERTGTADVEVDCPADVERKEGEVFECVISAPGGVRARLRAEQTDDEGGVEWTLQR